jgi:hypothetical protein
VKDYDYEEDLDLGIVEDDNDRSEDFNYDACSFVCLWFLICA